jgi:DNA anti-recombination protein RmuC
LRLHCALLGDTAQRIAGDVKRLEQTLQEAQSRYDALMNKEDARLKKKAKKRRHREARKLGTAKSIELAATALMDELKRARDALSLEGTFTV